MRPSEYIQNAARKEMYMSETKNKRSLGAHPLIYPLPVLLVGSYDASDKPNLMVAAWGGICSSDPLSVMVGVRKERWTYEALLKRKAFTVGVASERMLAAADYAGIASGRKQNKFEQAPLTPVKAPRVDAPYADECPVVLECSLLQSIDAGMHTMFIGQIVDVLGDEDCLMPGERGGGHPALVPDIRKVAPLIFDSGTAGYYSIGKRIGEAFSAGKIYLK